MTLIGKTKKNSGCTDWNHFTQMVWIRPMISPEWTWVKLTPFNSLPPIPRIKFIALQFLKFNTYTMRLQSYYFHCILRYVTNPMFNPPLFFFSLFSLFSFRKSKSHFIMTPNIYHLLLSTLFNFLWFLSFPFTILSFLLFLPTFPITFQ